MDQDSSGSPVLVTGEVSFSAVNIGSSERWSVADTARAVIERLGKDVELVFDPSKPTGPLKRSADTRLGEKLLGRRADGGAAPPGGTLRPS